MNKKRQDQRGRGTRAIYPYSVRANYDTGLEEIAIWKDQITAITFAQKIHGIAGCRIEVRDVRSGELVLELAGQQSAAAGGAA